MTYKLGSLFDGSGGFPLAGSLCGIEPVWAAEVEPYPIAVTRSRFNGKADNPLKQVLQHNFPNMKLLLHHLGDISKVNGAEIEPVDIITFGSPCQDLSVAGKRAGLKHEANGDEETTRSGLFMEAVRIIKEMMKATGGQYPRFALWENVPGAFSSQKGEDFRVVLEELIRIVEPGAVMPPVPKAGWAYADSYTGDGWSLAYRVFDAQYWGVPQRRRRIHLVVDFRGQCAQEVLFERPGLYGHFAEGRTPWQKAAAQVADRPGANDREGEGFDGYNGENITSPINAANPQPGDPCHTLGTDSRHYLVQPTYCLQGSMLGRADKNGPQGSGIKEKSCFTLNTIDQPAVAYPETAIRYIVRRLTPTECARLQGFADRWGDIDKKDSFTPEEYRFWLDVRNTHAAINGKQVKDYTEAQMLTWYNKLHTDSAEYKMWGNGIALPPALYCLQGIADVLNREEDDAWLL